MEEWKEYIIADICNIKHGFSFKGQYFTDSIQKYVCVTPGNFAIKGGFKLDKPKFYNGPIPAEYVLHADDLIVTMTDLSKEGDTLGYSALIPNQSDYVYLHNQRIGLVEKINNKIDKHFLYWVMRTYNYQRYVVNHCSGSTVKHTSPKNIGSYLFKAPSLVKQKNIALFLDNIDLKIELNRRINENLEQQAQALFKSWFVDFEPFKDGRFVDSELGMIPEGWKVGQLLDFGKIICGKTPSKNIKEFFGGDIPFIKIPDMHNQLFIVNTEDSLSVEGSKTQQTKLLPPYSLLVSCIATVGLVAINTKPSHTNQQINSIVPQNRNSLYYLYLNLILMKKQLESMGRGGTTTLNVNTTTFGKIRMIIPNNEILEKFSHIVEPLFKEIEITSKQSIELAYLRDTLLPKLMSGELKINDFKD